jgi:hypothetical protein
VVQGHAHISSRSAPAAALAAFVLVAAISVITASPVTASILEPRATDLAANFENATLVLGPTRRLAYGSQNGTLLLLESRDGTLVEVTKRYLWSPVLEMVAVDLDANGQDEIVGATQNGRLFVLRGTDLGDIWNTPENRFRSIRAVTAGDVDQTGQTEIVFIADEKLRIYQGMRDVLVWESTDTYTDNEIAIGDVDGDGRPEIVLNTSGKVLDAAFREVEWTYDPGFGTEMELFDIDADGRLEIIAVGADGLLRVFDVDERRVKID